MGEESKEPVGPNKNLGKMKVAKPTFGWRTFFLFMFHQHTKAFFVAENNSSAAFSEDDMLRERLAENIGTAGDSEVMNLNANSRVVVFVPADTKIYVVFTKHEQNPAELHKVVATAQ